MERIGIRELNRRTSAVIRRLALRGDLVLSARELQEHLLQRTLSGSELAEGDTGLDQLSVYLGGPQGVSREQEGRSMAR